MEFGTSQDDIEIEKVEKVKLTLPPTRNTIYYPSLLWLGIFLFKRERKNMDV